MSLIPIGNQLVFYYSTFSIDLMVEDTKEGYRYGGRTPREEGGTTQCANEVVRATVHGTVLVVQEGMMEISQKGKELRRSDTKEDLRITDKHKDRHGSTTVMKRTKNLPNGTRFEASIAIR